jgi:putative salt-induced outer membrane protein YdiY
MFPWRHYFYVGNVGFLQSSVQEVQTQTILGIGVGRYLKNSNRVRFSIQGGLGWQRTSYVPSNETQRLQNVAVAIIGPSLEVFSFKKTRLNLNAFVLPALNQRGRTFSRINTSYYIKLFGKVDWDLSFYGNWDTEPPAHRPGADYGTSVGLSWSFGNN